MKMIPVGDQWVRSDQVVYVHANKQILHVETVLGRSVIHDFPTITEASKAALQLVADVNAEIA